MRISLSDVRLDSVLAALDHHRFGTVKVSCDTRRQVESVTIFTEDTPTGPGGYEIGLIRREMASFARYEMILDTNRVETPRLMALLERIASENR
jgi:hypothetical protein